MMLAGTSDGRGIKQWNEVGRRVKKGEKAFFILAPKIAKVPKKPGTNDVDNPSTETNAKEESTPEETIERCVGFVPIPVFAMEQTDGEPLTYQKIELPELPLMEKAREWNIDVQGIAFQGDYLGYYQDRLVGEKIRLATPHEKEFFHELAHAAHRRVRGRLKSGQEPKQEVVAELCAQVLAEIVGREIESTIGNSFQYIKKYADAMNKDVGRACLSVLSDVQKVLELILPVPVSGGSQTQ